MKAWGMTGCRLALLSVLAFGFLVDCAAADADAVLKRAQQAEDARSRLPYLLEYLKRRPYAADVRLEVVLDEFDLHHYRSAVRHGLITLQGLRRHPVPAYEFVVGDRLMLLNYLGHSYLELNEPEKALHYYRKVYHIDHSSPKYSRYNFACCYIKLGDNRRAAICYEKAKQWGLNPNVGEEVENALRIHASLVH
jgi:tetratricopeptide (TPR) repeat protein